MKYSLDCPMGDKTLMIEADNKEMAVEKMMEQARAHSMEAHPDKPMDEEQMRKMIEDGMKEESMEEGGMEGSTEEGPAKEEGMM